MEEDDDDFYGGGGAAQQQQQHMKEEDGSEQKMEVSDEEDEDDSDDDVQFTLEKPEGSSAPEPPAKQQKVKHERTDSDSRPAKTTTPAVKKEEPRTGSTAPPTQIKGVLTHNGKEGKDYPEVRNPNSTLDVNATPNWVNGKPITEVDIDADLVENSKPWRLPGTDITDFFNYGFDEYTWASYCVRQQMMGNTVGQIKQDDAQMKAMMGFSDGGNGQKQGGGGGGGMPGMPPGMENMPPEQMMQMAQQMGIPPDAMMQMMGMGGGGMPGMGQGGQNQFQQGGFGSGQNSISPNPQPGQGFQPPQGPNAAGEGYSQQQLEMMQNMGGMGGGGRGGRNRRGRGW